jgi:hypothetical protein
VNALSPLKSARRGARQSRFAKKERCAYDTIDPRAVAALRPHIRHLTRFIEPCAGKGDLVRQLQAIGLECVDQFDIAPRSEAIRQQDALEWAAPWGEGAPIITNPPFDWPQLGKLIRHFITQAPDVWLLLEANWAHTLRAAPFLDHCPRIVSIGRLRWEEGSRHSSTKDYAWYLFGRTHIAAGPPTFHPRKAA